MGGEHALVDTERALLFHTAELAGMERRRERVSLFYFMDILEKKVP